MTKEILVLSGHSLDIRMNSGGLKIKDGFSFEEGVRQTYINRGTNDIEHIVILGQTGAITFDAIKWIIDQKIMVTFLDSEGKVITDFMPENHISAITKRRQATADNGLNIKIGAWLLAEKFKGQRETLNHMLNTCYKAGWFSPEREYRIGQAIAISQDRERALHTCLNADSQRVLEAQTAAAYWHCFEGIPLTWEKLKKVPVNWLAIGNRTSPKTGGPRKAIDPFNAGLNYLYAVLETRIRNSCIINSVDPDFGIIHVDQASRTSLVFDLMEPIRPKVDRLLFDWVLGRKFNPKDFFETREGICRVSPDITSHIIPLVKGLTPDIVKVVRELAGIFKNKSIIQRPDEFKETQKPKVVIKSQAKPGRVKQEKMNFAKPKVEVAKKELKKVVTGLNFIEGQCLECGEPLEPGKKFCCKRHKDTYRKRLLREKRAAEGKCPQCGGPMPEAANGTYKEKLTYCPKCAGYWKKRYEGKKADSC